MFTNLAILGAPHCTKLLIPPIFSDSSHLVKCCSPEMTVFKRTEKVIRNRQTKRAIHSKRWKPSLTCVWSLNHPKTHLFAMFWQSNIVEPQCSTLKPLCFTIFDTSTHHFLTHRSASDRLKPPMKKTPAKRQIWRLGLFHQGNGSSQVLLAIRLLNGDLRGKAANTREGLDFFLGKNMANLRYSSKK